MVNAACGCNILYKTAINVFALMSELSKGSRKFKRTNARSVSFADSSAPASQYDVAELKEMMQRFMLKGTPQQAKACGICYDEQHPTDACPQLQEPDTEVNAVGGYGP